MTATIAQSNPREAEVPKHDAFRFGDSETFTDWHNPTATDRKPDILAPATEPT